MTIKARELRIGNWVNGNSPFQVSGGDIALAHIREKALKTIHWTPIPLTEEWLVKFGYTNTNEEYLTGTLWRKGDDVHLPILIDKRGVVGILIYGAFKYLELGITVHRLQNLYFALTNEELTIK